MFLVVVVVDVVVVVVVVVGTPIEYYVASEDTVVAVEYVVAKATSFTFLLQCDSSTKFLKSETKERMKRLNAADIIHSEMVETR